MNANVKSKQKKNTGDGYKKCWVIVVLNIEASWIRQWKKEGGSSWHLFLANKKKKLKIIL